MGGLGNVMWYGNIIIVVVFCLFVLISFIVMVEGWDEFFNGLFFDDFMWGMLILVY